MLYRSVHNVRIERLWVDVTAQVGAFWADIFTELELRYGLDINNIHHIWLLHHLFLRLINQQLTFFAESWNQHRIQIRDGPNRSPADMFGFDMLVHGVRGDQLPDEDLTEEELEMGTHFYDSSTDSVETRNSTQARTSNIGCAHPMSSMGRGCTFVCAFHPDLPFCPTTACTRRTSSCCILRNCIKAPLHAN
jgi:hypothetical protein